MWCNNMKKYRMLLIWHFWIYHKCDICFFERNSLFILIEYDSLTYFIIWIHETIFMPVFFLITIKTCIFCDAVLSFFWISWSIELCIVNIYKIMNNCNYISWEHIYFCEWNYNICWLCSDSLKSCKLIISEILINLLT